MMPESEGKFVKVVFPEAGVTIQAKPIEPQDIEEGKRYLLDRDHNADIILEPTTAQPLPEGWWQLVE